MKNFTKGFLSGAAVLATGVAATLYGMKKAIVEPIQEKEEKEKQLEENRKQAMRRSRAR